MIASPMKLIYITICNFDIMSKTLLVKEKRKNLKVNTCMNLHAMYLLYVKLMSKKMC